MSMTVVARAGGNARSHRDDPVAADRHVSSKSGLSGSVDDDAPREEQVVAGGRLARLGNAGSLPADGERDDNRFGGGAGREEHHQDGRVSVVAI